jgi:hypothetical protein
VSGAPGGVALRAPGGVALRARGGVALRARRLIAGHAVIFTILAVWAFAPLVVVVAHVLSGSGTLTGVNGADFFDQFQYLAWIRDEGSHVLASNLWSVAGTPHDYVQPMYLISGLLWRLGLSVQLAYLVWKPVAVVVLFLGFAGYVRRLVSGRWAATAALALALFYESPVYALASWTGHLSGFHRIQLVLTTDDAESALNLWGFDHAAIAIGLMPVFLVAAEKLLAGADAGRPVDRRWSAASALAGLLVAWLHPWQAVTLLAIVGTVWLLRPTRGRLWVLAVPVAATLLPLAYGVALSRFDPSWSMFQRESTATGTGPWWALLASFAPLVVFAAAGVRRPRSDREWMLVLWPLAVAAVYLFVPQFPPHALAGLMLPLAILAVRGWSRVRSATRVPAPAAAALAVAAVLSGVLPAAIFHAQGVHDDVAATTSGAITAQQLRLTPDQAAAVSYLARTPRPGAVLAPWLLSMSIPGLTGRPVYAGHGQWQPPSHVTADVLFFSRSPNDPTGRLRRAILRSSGARFVLADCGAPASLGRSLGPVARPARRFGCETVYEVYGAVARR